MQMQQKCQAQCGINQRSQRMGSHCTHASQQALIAQSGVSLHTPDPIRHFIITLHLWSIRRFPNGVAALAPRMSSPERLLRHLRSQLLSTQA